MMNPVFKEKIAPKWHYLDLRLRYLCVAFISQAWLFIGVISYVWNDIIIDAPKDIARYAIFRSWHFSSWRPCPAMSDSSWNAP
jgi:hypothetical protein